MRHIFRTNIRAWGAGIVMSSFVLLASTSAAHADATNKLDAEAARMFHEGVAAANQARDDKAIALFLAAIARDPQPDYFANLGVTEVNAKRYRDAAEHLSYYLRTVRQMSDEDRKLIENMLKKAEETLGWLTLHVDIAGADIFVDDKHVGTSPLSRPVYVDAGTRKVQIIKGNQATTRMVDVAPGTKPVLEILVEPPPSPPQSAAIKPAEFPPISPTKLRDQKIVRAGIAVSATLGAIGIGTLIGAVAVDRASYERWSRNQCTRSNADCMSDFDDSQSISAGLGSASIGMFIGGGLVGIATTLYAFRGQKPAPAAVSLQMGPREWAIAWGGVF